MKIPFLVSLLFYCLVLCAYSLVSGCGKKGEPTLKLYEKPPQPSGLNAIHRESEIILLWDFPDDKEEIIKGFYIFKSSGKDFEKIAFVERNIRSFRDSDFSIGSEYQYKIVSNSLRNIYSIDSNIIKVIPQAIPLPPQEIKFRIEPDSLTLEWGKSNGENFYNIYRTYKQGEYGLFPINKEPLRQNSFTDNLNVQKKVYYTIRSLTASSSRDEGPASEELEIDPEKFIPSKIQDIQVVITENYIYLLWKESPERWIEGYNIYRKKDGDKFYTFIGNTQIPAFIDRDKTSIKRNYRITAVGPGEESPPADIQDIMFVKD
ncbi:MAG: hypothetical protein HXY53_07835 [Nitrospirae bacterium]|nr:hypothetical protein [Nitrospirota bacterium]